MRIRYTRYHTRVSLTCVLDIFYLYSNNPTPGLFNTHVDSVRGTKKNVKGAVTRNHRKYFKGGKKFTCIKNYAGSSGVVC